MVARFLHYFPQYRLEDLDTMSPGVFWWLMGGMLDNEDPHATETHEETMTRRAREIAEKHHAQTRKRGGWG